MIPRMSRHVTVVVTVASLLVMVGAVYAQEDSISLAGEWRFALDRDDVGVTEAWSRTSIPERIALPGALQSQGFGDEVSVDTRWTANVNDRSWYTDPRFEEYRKPGHVKIPFWLQPDRHYVGAAWYQRDIEIPPRWDGRRVVLTLERPHWGTRVWVDGRSVGSRDSLSTPHVYDLGAGLQPGRHPLTIRVDNRMLVDVGVWAHSVSDHTQGNWNGIVGRIELTSTTPVWIDDVQVFPNVARKTVRVAAQIGNLTGQPGKGTLTVGSQEAPVTWNASFGKVSVEVALGDGGVTWDEFRPALQQLDLHLRGDDVDHRRQVTYGLREITTSGRDFLVNGRKTFFRGTLECCIFPRTGYPPTDVEDWRRIIRIAKEHGLNHIRFHSWCPPEAAFVAADELGFYYQVECAGWARIGDGEPVDKWIYEESDRIVRAYGNHPSFVLMAYGNEPSGPRHKEYLAKFVDFWKERDTRRIYTAGSGWPVLDESQYHVTPAPRGPSGWIGKDYRGRIRDLEVPVIVHEMGQWCVYPNFDEIAKYTGPLKARNFEIFRDSLEAHGMIDQRRDFLRASGRLQVLCYKEEVEAALRTPGVAGVQLLDLHDFPGQGTALVGILDPFWDSKGYVEPEEFRRFFGATVPLARLEKRVWTTDETLTADVEIAHFGATPIERQEVIWKVMTSGKDAKTNVVAGGLFPARSIPIGQGILLGRVELQLDGLPAPGQYRLVVALPNTTIENDWALWLYPAQSPQASTSKVLAVSTFDERAAAELERGGTVFVATPVVTLRSAPGSWTPIFWNRQWFPRQKCQTLGLLCDPTHPALRDFPTDFHSDWQWEDIVNRSRGVDLDGLPAALRPIVQVIDDWNTNRKLALVFECRVGEGKLLVCTTDLDRDIERRPAARQLRHSLLCYAASSDFDPKVEVPLESVQELLTWIPPSTLVGLGARVIETDSEEAGYEASNAVDGDPLSIWHTRWSPTPAPHPHHLTIELGKEVSLLGITCLPRQDMSNGRIARCEMYCSRTLGDWGEPVARAEWPNSGELQTLRFEKPTLARYVKLVALSEVRRQPFTSIAELDVLLEPSAR